MRLVAAYTGDVSTLLATFWVREICRWEQRRCRWSCAKYDIRISHELLQQPLVLGVAGCEQIGFGLAVVFRADWIHIIRVVWQRVVDSHYTIPSGVEAAVDDVEVVDLIPSEE